MMVAACGVSVATASSTPVPVVSAPRATVVTQSRGIVESTKPKVAIPKVVKSDEEPPKKVTPSTKATRGVTIKDINNNIVLETLEVVFLEKKQKSHACFMTDCGQPSPSIKKHVIGKHLSLAFATWKEMPNEERMVLYNQSLMSLEAVPGLSINHDELLQLVVEKKWFPVDTRFTILEEDAKFVEFFHQWLTGNQLTSKPTVDPQLHCRTYKLESFSHCSQLHWGGEGNIT